MAQNNGKLLEELLKRKADNTSVSTVVHDDTESATPYEDSNINRNLYYYGGTKQTIVSISDKLHKRVLESIKRAERDEQHRLENLSYALKAAEKCVLYLRQEIINCTPKSPCGMPVGDLFDGEVTAFLNGNILEVKIPALLPRRTYLGNSKYFPVEISNAIKKLNLSSWDRQGKYFIVFIRFYGKNIPKNKLKDCDNVEEKSVIDSFRGILFEDDDPFHVSFIEITEEGDDLYTGVYIVPEYGIADFLKKHLNGKK